MKNNLSTTLLSCAALLAVGIATAATTQQVKAKPVTTKIKAKNVYILQLPPVLMQALGAEYKKLHPHADIATTPTGIPSLSINAPNAFGATAPAIFASSLYVSHWHGTYNQDGNVSFGVTFGNAMKGLGFTFSTVIDAVGVDQTFAKNGGVGLRINHYFTPSTAMAAGVGNMAGWGSWNTLSHNFYLDVSHSFNCKLPIAVNIGAGTGAFFSIDQGKRGSDAFNKIGPFGSVGVGLFKNFSAILDYATKQLAIGGNYSILAIPKFPIYVSAAYVNINRDGDVNPYFQATAGVAYTF